MPDLPDLRRDYTAGGLSEAEIAPRWEDQLRRWLDDATASPLVTEPNAVVLATVAADGQPSARTVLLKGLDERGLVVYTNLTSRKATEALGQPRASLVFPWVPLERQVVVVGRVEPVSRDEVEIYFRSRPRSSQVGAWVSHQSTVIASREVLEAREAELTERFEGGDVPVPDFWGGLRVVPTTVELWQGRTSRLHDRLRYDLVRGVVERLSP